MMAVLSLVLDLVIVGLLAATIVYAVLLNRQIVRLRDSRGELQAMIKGFNEATGRAEAGVKGMKRVATESGEALQKAIERAQTLRDELQQIVETGDALASRIEGLAADRSRTAAPAVPAERDRERLPPRGGGLPAVRQRGADEGLPEPAAPRRGRPPAPDGRGRTPPVADGDGKSVADELDGLSRAERELLKAIEGRR